MVKITFGENKTKKDFTPAQKEELREIVKSSVCEWIFTVHPNYGYWAMSEYISSYTEPGKTYPIILQKIIASPGEYRSRYDQNKQPIEFSLKQEDWNNFKDKLKESISYVEREQFCSFCNCNHQAMFIWGKSYCILNLENSKKRNNQP